VHEQWHQIWIPVVPGGGRDLHDAIADEDIRAIVRSNRVRDSWDVERLAGEPRLHGMVTNRVDSLNRDEIELLDESYPGTDFSKCLIIQEGRKPADKRHTMFFLSGAAFLLVTGVCLALFGWSQGRPHSDGLSRSEAS